MVANYACHCTTLTREHNFVHGDWAGCAQQEIEAAHPGATALVVIGCTAFALQAQKQNVSIHKVIERSAERGSYALGTGNSVPDYTPDENYFAMTKAVLT